MLPVLQKAKLSFQPAVIRNPHGSDYIPRFGNSKRLHPNVKMSVCLHDVAGNKLLQRCKKWTYYYYHFCVALLWEMALLYVSQNTHLLSESLHQVTYLRLRYFCSLLTLYILIVNHNLSEHLFNEFYPSSENNYIAKKCHFPGMMFLSHF